MEGGGGNVGLAREDGLAAERREDLDVGTDGGDAGGADEEKRQLAVVRSCLEAVELTAVRVAGDGDVEEIEAPLFGRCHAAGRQDDPCAHRQDRTPASRESQERRLETEALDESQVHAALAPGQDEAAGEIEIGGSADLEGVMTQG